MLRPVSAGGATVVVGAGALAVGAATAIEARMAEARMDVNCMMRD